MANVRPPEKYNSDELYLYCELTTSPEIGGGVVDFSGIKTYNIGFLKEGVGFGITNINVDITPSMQPVIEITFKDFYGNSSIEFRRNSEFLGNLIDDTKSINYASIFELPYPKFKLILKGYIGKVIALDLNVKRIDVTYVANDGSYEIKAVFVPNLYGFFADLPFYFLKSIKYLKFGTGENVPDTYVSIFDIIENGKKVQQSQTVIQKNIEKLKKNLMILNNETDEMFYDDFNWFDSNLLDDKTSNQENILGYKKLFVNVGKYFTNQTKDVRTSIFGSESKSKQNRDQLSRLPESKKKIISSISNVNEHLNNNPKLVYFNQPLNITNYNNAKELIKQALIACDNYEKTQFRETNKDVLEALTIKKVFDLLVQDSSYLMGRILQAGVDGYNRDSNKRNEDKKITGKYFPLIPDETTNEQKPYAVSGPEVDFVNQFISALSNGIAEGERKKIDQEPITPESLDNVIKKRITNLEIGAKNPYSNAYTANDIISNIIERTGILAHFFMDTISTGDSDIDNMISSEIENIKVGLDKILGNNKEDRNELLTFFNTITKIISDDNQNSLNVNDVSIITKYINEKVSLINKTTLKAKRIYNNNIFYNVDELSNGDTYVLFDTTKFKLNAVSSGIIGSSENEEITDITIPFSDDDFKYYYVEQKDSDNPSSLINLKIGSRKVYDYSKLQTESDIKKCIVDEKIGTNTKYTYSEKKYFYAKYRLDYRNSPGLLGLGEGSPYTWDLLGTTSEAQLQRYALKEISKKLKTEVVSAENKIKDDTKIINNNIQSGQGFEIIYKQFHNLCNNWKNLVDGDSNSGQKTQKSNIVQDIIERFSKNIFYEFPLQNIQSKTQINVSNAIINIEPLYKNNEQSTILNVMSNICLKNNFMFLAIPGMADSDGVTITNEPLDGLLLPYTNFITNKDVKVGNHFYVLWMPTPENRATLNNGQELYLDFDADNINLSRPVFIIDYGSPNNTIFKSVNMTTEDNKMTSESAIAINTIADPQNSNKFKSFDCSALSVMEGRSYKISVEMIGNAQIKPTQFFILNSTHIFSGLYQIMKVSHTIRPNDMVTKFEAIKMKYNGSYAGFSYIAPITLESLAQQTTDYYNSNNYVLQTAQNPGVNQIELTSEYYGVNDLKNNPSQLKALSELHPAIRNTFSEFINDIENNLGYHVIITDGYRSIEDSKKLKDSNNKNAIPGFSFHNYGMAIDINLQSQDLLIKKATPKAAWLKSGVVDIAKKYNLRWGGNFSNYYDPIHFDAGNIYNIKDLNTKFMAQNASSPGINGNEINLA